MRPSVGTHSGSCLLGPSRVVGLDVSPFPSVHSPGDSTRNVTLILKCFSSHKGRPHTRSPRTPRSKGTNFGHGSSLLVPVPLPSTRSSEGVPSSKPMLRERRRTFRHRVPGREGVGAWTVRSVVGCPCVSRGRVIESRTGVRRVTYLRSSPSSGHKPSSGRPLVIPSPREYSETPVGASGSGEFVPSVRPPVPVSGWVSGGRDPNPGAKEVPSGAPTDSG